jgi:hypothetical protein
MTEEISEYLGRESAKEKTIMARFRCGNEEIENRCRMERDERTYRTCYEERERQLSKCGADVAKWERERKERGEISNEDGRDGETEDKMDEKDMEEILILIIAVTMTRMTKIENGVS